MKTLSRLALTISVLIALTMAGIQADLNKSEWASWVQAVGAILAIVGAFLVARWQFTQSLRAAHEEKLEEHRASLRATIELVDELLTDVDQLIAAVQLTGDAQLVAFSAFNDVRWSTRRRLIHEWSIMGAPAPSLRIEWMHVQWLVDTVDKEANWAVSARKGFFAPDWNNVLHDLTGPRAALTVSRDRFDKALKAL